MPTVPRRTGPSVGTNALPGVRQQAFDQGSIDIAPVTNLVSAIHQEERKKADQMAVQEVDNQLFAIEDDIRKRAKSVRGREAVGAVSTADAEWKERVGAVEATLKSPYQKAMARDRAENYRRRLLGSLEQHADGELRRYDETETKSALENRMRFAAENFDKQEDIDNAIAESVATVLDFSSRNGMGPEAREAMLAETVSGVHASVLSSMITKGQDARANEYYEANKGELQGKDKDRIERDLEVGSISGRALRHATEILKTEGITRSAALEAANTYGGENPTDLDLKIRKEARREIELQLNEQERAKNEQQEADSEQAWQLRLAGKPIPPALRNALPSKVQGALDDYEMQQARGKPVKTDLALYYGLMSAASDPDQRDAFANENLMQYVNKLDETEFKQLTMIQMSLRKKDANPVVRGITTTYKDINDRISTVSVWQPKKSDSEPEKQQKKTRMINFTRSVNEAVIAEKTRLKRDQLSPTEMNAIVEPMIVREIFSGTTDTDNAATIRHIETDDQGRVYQAYDVIPPNDRTTIENLMRAAGREPKPKQVERAYARVVLDGRGLQRLIDSGNRGVLNSLILP